MKFCTLASGSSGNCAVIKSGDTAILIDAGISMRRIKQGLAETGLLPEDISAILVTHCHTDHISGIKMMSKYYHLPILAPRITAGMISSACPEAGPYIRFFEPGQPFHIGEIDVMAFRTPHDAYDSVGYMLSAEGKRLAYVTDLGHVSDEILETVLGADAAIIESNHDIEMLKTGPYPYPLKRRILSESGHLSNEACGKLAIRLAESGAKTLLLAHLSRENNTPSLAYKTVRQCLDENGCCVNLFVAPADEKSETFTL